jgi:hypothetical protein
MNGVLRAVPGVAVRLVVVLLMLIPV